MNKETEIKHKRLMEIRSELFDFANSFAGDETGNIAIILHSSCNKILTACNSLHSGIMPNISEELANHFLKF